MGKRDINIGSYRERKQGCYRRYSTKPHKDMTPHELRLFRRDSRYRSRYVITYA